MCGTLHLKRILTDALIEYSEKLGFLLVMIEVNMRISLPSMHIKARQRMAFRWCADSGRSGRLGVFLYQV